MTATQQEQAQEIVNGTPFDFTAYLINGGVTLPEADVTIFTDQQAAYRVQQIDWDLDKIRKSYLGSITGPPEEETGPLENERGALADQIFNTRIVVHMRGVLPSVHSALIRHANAITKKNKWEPEDRQEWINYEFWRKSIIKRTFGDPADGKYSDVEMDHEECKFFLEYIPTSQAELVSNMAAVLTFGVELADKRADAGFPGGATDPTRELQLPPLDQGSPEVEPPADRSAVRPGYQTDPE